MTLDKVRRALTRPLLPIEPLCEIVDSHLPGVNYHELSRIENDDEFIIVAYERLLGRPPGPNCLANWLKCINDRSLSRAEFVDRLRESDEGKARQVKVYGLDDALALSSKKFYKRWTGWLAWKRRTIRQRLWSQLQDPLASGGLADRVLVLEQQVSAAAASCLQVFEHIECRLGKAYASSQPVAATIAQPLDTEPISDRLAQLHQRMTELLSEAEPTYLGSAMAHVSELLAQELQSFPWMFAGVEAHEVIQASKQQRIEVGPIATSTACLSFAKRQGIEAVDVPLRQFLQAADQAAAGVIWLRSQFSRCSDDYLIDRLQDIERILAPGGCIVIEEDDQHSIHALKLRAALEICGYRWLSPDSLSAWERPEQRACFVAQKTASVEVINNA